MLRWQRTYNWSLDWSLKIPRCTFKLFLSSENNHTDLLANLGQPHSFSSDGRFSSAYCQSECLTTNWRGPSPWYPSRVEGSFIAYLKDGMLSDDRAEAQKLLHLTTRYRFLRDILYEKFYFKLHADPWDVSNQMKFKKWCIISMVATIEIIWRPLSCS